MAAGHRKGLGRPPKLTPEQKESLRLEFMKYIESEEIPIIAEFAYLMYNMDLGIGDTRAYLYDNFSTLIEKAIKKKESALEKKSLHGEVNTTQAIFSLKQLGWRDRQEIEHSGGQAIQITRRVVTERQDSKADND